MVSINPLGCYLVPAFQQFIKCHSEALSLLTSRAIIIRLTVPEHPTKLDDTMVGERRGYCFILFLLFLVSPFSYLILHFSFPSVQERARHNCNIDWAEKTQIKRTNKLASFNIFASLSRCPKLFYLTLFYWTNIWKKESNIFQISPFDIRLCSYMTKQCAPPSTWSKFAPGCEFVCNMQCTKFLI